MTAVTTHKPRAGEKSRLEEFSVQQIAYSLSDDLGPQLVALMLGVSDKTIHRWASGTTSPRLAEETKLRDLFALVQFMLKSDSRHVVRAWLIGMNQMFDDQSPANVIAQGRIADVFAAARIYATEG